MFRWSVRRGTLCLYPSGPSMTMLFASLHPRRAAQPVTVSLEIGGRLVDRFEIGDAGATRRTVFLPEALAPRPGPRAPFGDLKESLRLDRPEWHLVTIQARSVGTAVLTLQASRVWRPSETGPASDRRHLGVQVAPIRVEREGAPGG